MWAKQSTAATLIVGPILDSTGAEFTTAVIGDLSLSKNGGTLTALAAAATLTHVANGQYTLVMTTGNLDTLGRLQITCNKSTYQMPEVRLMVVPAMVFDSMVLGTDVLQGDVTQISGDTLAADNAEAFFDGTGYAGTNNVIPTVTDVTNGVTLAATQPAITFGAVTIDVSGSTPNITLTGSGSGNGIEWTRSGSGDPLDADVVDQIQSGLSTLDASGVRSAVGLASANLDTQLGDIPTFAEFEARSIVAANYATSSVLSTVEGKIDTIDNFIDTEVLAIKAVTDKIDTGLVLDGPVWQFTANMLELAPSGTGGDATLAKQAEILAAIQGSEVIQVASPNVLGNLVLTQGDSYDGIANPKATWTVTTDYTSGWTVVLTIRDKDDAVIYTTSGTVVNSTTITVTIAAPTGLDMTGCPGQWQGKFDVQLTKAESIKTIALGTCYINEDQTR